MNNYEVIDHEHDVLVVGVADGFGVGVAVFFGVGVGCGFGVADEEVSAVSLYTFT